jgi:hypothetical protein
VIDTEPEYVALHGHHLGPLMWLGDCYSADCARPGCNMGLTRNGDGTIVGSAAVYICPASVRDSTDRGAQE